MSTLESTTLVPGIHRGMPAEDYFAIPAVSATFLKRFLLDTPAHAKAMLDGLLEEETSAMSKGTALHTALLEPEEFEKQIAIGPEENRNTKIWKAFAADNPDKMLFKPSEVKGILAMRDGIRGDRYCSHLLRSCEYRELTVIWNDQATGLPCKARIDLYSASMRMLLDVKTTGQMDRFARTAFDYGYEIQLAHYTRAIAQFEATPVMSGILAVDSSAPWLPQVFEATADLLIIGHSLIERAMPLIASCMKAGKWPGYQSKNTPTPLDVPTKRERLTYLDRGNFNV